MTSANPSSTSTPTSAGRRLRLLGVAVCIALVASCSSGSGSGSGSGDDQAAGDTRVDVPVDGAAGDDTATVPVCALLEPVADDLVAAFAVGIPVTDEGLYERGESECFIDFSDESVPAGELSTARIWVKRIPAIFSDADAVADTVDIGDPSPASSVAPDAVVIDDGHMGIVLFAVGERVYEVSTSYPYDDTADGATPIAQAVVAVAEVAHGAIAG